MIDQQTFEELSPRALEWAKAQEQLILERGCSLSPRAFEDAVRVGVQDPSRVRVLIVDRVPLPSDAALAKAARQTQIITDASGGAALGYGVIIRADRWGDRELLVHQLVHIAQCERSGGLEQFVQEYLVDRHTSPSFAVGALEDEARRMAREVCAPA